MSLNLDKLENAVTHGEKTIARCPACAEQGEDRTGNHLVVFPDGRFACVVHTGPDGRKHRQRIYQLTGSGVPTPRRAFRFQVRPTMTHQTLDHPTINNRKANSSASEWS